MNGGLLTQGTDDRGRSLVPEATTCAIAILIERVGAMPKDDREDLFELAKIVFSCDDEEEREAAGEAMIEILSQKPPKLADWPKLSERDDEEIKSWTSFVANAVRQARKEADVTQTILSELTGIQQSHLSRIEKGQVSPTRKTLEKIADALKCDVKRFDPSA